MRFLGRARVPAPGDRVLVDGAIDYRVSSPSSIRDVVYVERPCGCEWLLLDLGQMRWDRRLGAWMVARSAALAAGAK